MRATKPILIAGAGPTGLTLAHCLAAYRVPFQIVDAKSGPSRDSKALVVNPLAQYQMALLGQGEALGRGAVRIRRANVYWKNATRLNALDLRWLDFPVQTFISQPQAATEQQLISALPASVKVAWHTRLLDVTQDASGVSATLEKPHGVRETLRFDYVVGCEGKASVVREAIGAELTGWDYPMHFLLGDFKLRWRRPPDQAYYHVFDDTFFVIVPIGGDYWRIVVKKDGAFDPSAPIQAQAIADTLARYVDDARIADDPIWLSGAPFYMRVATALRRERLFICGDAAHLFSPIGGTGMNTGMQDAMNLGWKLAYVQRGFSKSEALLASYAAERAPAIQQAAAAADMSTKLIARIETAPERVAPMLPHLRRRRLVRNELPIRQAGLALEYAPSSVVELANSAVAKKPGTLCHGLLDLRRQLGAGRMRPLDTALLVFASQFHGALKRALGVLRRELRAFAGQPIALHLIALAEATDYPKAIAVTDPATLRRLGAVDAGLLAIRPDGFVAFSGTVFEPQGLLDLLGRWFVSDNSAVQARIAPSVDSNVDGAE